VQKVFDILEAPVNIDKSQLSFIEVSLAYKNKIQLTGEAIVNLIECETDEVTKSLKIIEFQRKLQADPGNYLGHMGYEKIKEVYEKRE